MTTQNGPDDLRSGKAALLAKLADPRTPPFPGAVAIACDECHRHITWVNQPAPPVPTFCTEHGRPGALTVADPS